MQTFGCVLLLLSTMAPYPTAKPLPVTQVKSFQPGTEFTVTIQEWRNIPPEDYKEDLRGLNPTGELVYSYRENFHFLPRLESDAEPQFVFLQTTENRCRRQFALDHPRPGVTIQFQYPPLIKGHIIPIFGAVCLIKKVETERRDELGSETMLLRILKDSELPPGVRHPLLRHALPFGAIMPQPHTRPMFRLLEYVPPSDSEPETAVRGEIMIREQEEPILKRLVVGDVIQLPPDPLARLVVPPRLVIRDIVPPDPKTKVIGWILVEPEQFVESSPADALVPRNSR